MPDISQANLKQWCVVWQKSDTKTRKGQPRVSSPTNVRCRWVTGEQSNVDQDGTTHEYPTSLPVGTSVALGSFIWGPGKFVDLPSRPTYLEVVGVAKTPDLKGRHPTYVLSLRKASQTLPEVIS